MYDVMLIRLHERIKSTDLVRDLAESLVEMLLVANELTKVLLKSCYLVQNVARMLWVQRLHLMDHALDHVVCS